jgi:hypothetical protein
MQQLCSLVGGDWMQVAGQLQSLNSLDKHSASKNRKRISLT